MSLPSVVVTSAMKAVKDITINGEVAILEASTIKESWETFTNILLERTVINTVYERDFIKLDVVKCENVRLPSVFPLFSFNVLY